MTEILIAFANAFLSGLASWCVAVGPNLMGLRKLRPHVELQLHMEQRESVGNGAETKRPTGLGYDAFVTLSAPAWKR